MTYQSSIAKRARSVIMRKFVSRKRRYPAGLEVILRQARDWYVLFSSGAFDRKWYLREYPDVARSWVPPLVHFVRCGAAERRNPNPVFDTTWYVTTYRDVSASRANPLVHYLSSGAKEGRDPGPRFDSSWYMELNPNLAAKGLNPLVHFLRNEKRKKKLFDSKEQVSTQVPAPVPVEAVDAESFSFVKAKKEFDFRERVFPQDGIVSRETVMPVRHVWEEGEETGFKVLYGKSNKRKGTKNSKPSATTRHRSLELDPYVAQLNDVFIIGGTRYVITSGRVALHDEVAMTIEDETIGLKHHLSKRGENRRVAITCKYRANTDIGTGIHLMTEYEANYFHNLVEILPRILLAEKCNIPETVPFLVTDDLHENLKELIQSVNVSNRPIVYLGRNVAYHVKELYYPSDVSMVLDVIGRKPQPEESVIASETIREVCDTIFTQKNISRRKERSRRVYLSRGKRYRALLNEQAVQNMLVDLGIEILSLDGLSVEAQMKIFRETEIVIAPTGAAATNMVWCQPGTPIVILHSNHEHHQLEVWRKLGVASGVDVHFLEGSRAYNTDGIYAAHDDYTVDVEKLDKLAKELIGQV